VSTQSQSGHNYQPVSFPVVVPRPRTGQGASLPRVVTPPPLPQAQICQNKAETRKRQLAGMIGITVFLFLAIFTASASWPSKGTFSASPWHERNIESVSDKGMSTAELLQSDPFARNRNFEFSISMFLKSPSGWFLLFCMVSLMVFAKMLIPNTRR